ncbi:hypothetical protein GCM10029963_66710 [Micromonospora andamanensis]
MAASAGPRADQLAALRDLPTEQVERARQFRSALRPGGWAALGVGLLVALALGLTPLGSRLIEVAGRPFGDHWIAQAILGGLAVVLVADLVTLPFSAWRHGVLTRYGLATNGWGGWAVDLLKSYAVSAVIGAVALLGFYAVVRLAPAGGGRSARPGRPPWWCCSPSCSRCSSSRSSTGSARWSRRRCAAS